MVIAAGGGGIPVVRRAGQLKGSEAVIDKDRCSALLAMELGAELLVFSTGVTHVYLHFGKRGRKAAVSCELGRSTRLICGRASSPRAAWGRK